MFGLKSSSSLLWQVLEMDALQLHLCMDSAYVKDLLSVRWCCESGLVENIDLVVEEYRQSRHLLVSPHTTTPAAPAWCPVTHAAMLLLSSPLVCVCWDLLQQGRAHCPNASVKATDSTTSL